MAVDYLQALGVGAGFDTKAIVTALVDADKASKQSAIDRGTKNVEASVSGMGQLKSSLATLQAAFQRVDDKRDFNFSTVSNSDPSLISANFDTSTALPGTYKVSVSQLAQNDVVQSSSYASISADQNGAAAATVTIQVGAGASETVSLAAGSATMEGLVEGINELTADVSARIVETSPGNFRVVVEGPQGSSNALTITDDAFGLATAGNKIQTAQNAAVSVNGLAVSSASNQLDGLVPGLELNLMSTTTTDVVLSVGRDTTVAKAAITGLVDAYNTFEGVMKELTASGSVGVEEGSLKSDSAVKAIRQQMRDFLTADSSSPGTTTKNMTDLGVSLQRDGTFKIDQEQLGTALSGYYADITQMFSANTNDQSSYSTDNAGMAGDLVNQIASYLAHDGVVSLREATYAKTKSDLTADQVTLDKKMESVEARYTKQFSTMSKIMDEMKSTQDYLESQLDSLPFTSNNN
jgi:flagellar hook-associated protein 2